MGGARRCDTPDNPGGDGFERLHAWFYTPAGEFFRPSGPAGELVDEEQAIVSLDGVIADDHDKVGPLFDWLGNGDVVWSFNDDTPDGWKSRTTSASAEFMREIYADVVVKVIGRRRFDMTNGWGGKPVAGEHVIVDTREPPSSLRTGRWCRPGLPPTAPPEASVAFWAELMDHESTTFEVQHVFTDGDWAAVRWRYRFGSTDAASVPDVKVTRVSGGRIIEQLGHTRTPGGLPLPE